MRFKLAITLLLSLCAVQQASAQQAQPSIQVLAQAIDMCMATYAVRLTRTAASDEEIYAQAAQSCQAVEDQLTTALKAQLAPAQAAEVLQAMEAQEKPNFMAMLTQIRSDRARQGG